MLSKFKAMVVLGALAMSGAAITPASADAVFSLSGISFVDGGTASGYISFGSLGYLKAWDVTTTTTTTGSPPVTFAGYEYTPVINAHVSSDFTVVELSRPGYVGYLHLVFETSLSNVALGVANGIYSTSLLDVADSYECTGFAPTCGHGIERAAVFNEEAESVATVPEPASLTLMGFGLLVVGFLFARRRKASGLA